MLVFLDESFRKNSNTGRKFGVLAGITVPETIYGALQFGAYKVRQPYHGNILKEYSELHGTKLLTNKTMRTIAEGNASYHWNLAQEMLQYTKRQNVRVFGVVCFREDLHTFICNDEERIDTTYRYLFERIDRFMKNKFPHRYAKLIFDDRDHKTNKINARTITNFFNKSSIGLGYDSIIRVPMFAVSQGHNYGLQIADLVTTVIGLRFQGDERILPLWNIVKEMLYFDSSTGRRVSSLKVMRHKK